MTSPVFAPDVATYASRVPYITASEFREAGTGADTSKLIPGRPSQEDLDAALDRVIARASSWADTYCRKVLAATTNTSAGRVRPDPRDGSLGLPLPYTPVVAVTAVSVGATALSLTPLSDLSTVWIDGSVARVAAPCWSSYGFMQVTYVNGWANALLTQPAAEGDTTIVVDNPLGIFPGMTLTIDDGGNSELATVDPSYVPGQSSVVLTGGLGFSHPLGAPATMMPQAIKQAVILLTAALIRTRGSSSISMASISSSPEVSVSTLPGGSKEQALAEELLQPFRRTW